MREYEYHYDIMNVARCNNEFKKFYTEKIKLNLNLNSKLCNSILEIIKDVINFHYQ